MLWCENQMLDKTHKVLCLAHLAESRVLDCPYTNEEQRLQSEYPCSDFKEARVQIILGTPRGGSSYSN